MPLTGKQLDKVMWRSLVCLWLGSS